MAVKHSWELCGSDVHSEVCPTLAPTRRRIIRCHANHSRWAGPLRSHGRDGLEHVARLLGWHQIPLGRVANTQYGKLRGTSLYAWFGALIATSNFPRMTLSRRRLMKSVRVVTRSLRGAPNDCHSTLTVTATFNSESRYFPSSSDFSTSSTFPSRASLTSHNVSPESA